MSSNAEEIEEKLGFDVIDHGTHGSPKDACMSVDMLEDMMQAHTNQTLQDLKERIKERERKLDEKISKLNLSGNPDDWILANGIEQVKMGVHSVITLIDEVSNE